MKLFVSKWVNTYNFSLSQHWNGWIHLIRHPFKCDLALRVSSRKVTETPAPTSSLREVRIQLIKCKSLRRVFKNMMAFMKPCRASWWWEDHLCFTSGSPLFLSLIRRPNLISHHLIVDQRLLGIFPNWLGNMYKSNSCLKYLWQANKSIRHNLFLMFFFNHRSTTWIIIQVKSKLKATITKKLKGMLIQRNPKTISQHFSTSLNRKHYNVVRYTWQRKKRSTLDYSLPIERCTSSSRYSLFLTRGWATDFRHAFILSHSSSGQFAFHP